MNGLSKYYIKKIIGCFADEFTATETSRKLKVNRNTVNKYYRIIREAIADYQEMLFNGQAKNGNDTVFCLYWHRSNGITTANEPDAVTYHLTLLNSRVYIEDKAPKKAEQTAGAPEQASAEENAAALHELATTGLTGRNNGGAKNVETAYNFFLYAKDKLTKFYGVKEEYSYLYLKELTFRFNNRDKDVSQIIWKILPHHSPEWAKTSRYRK